MAFQVPTTTEMYAMVSARSKPVTYIALDPKTGKEEVYKGTLKGGCDDTEAAIAALAGQQGKGKTAFSRVRQASLAGGKLSVGDKVDWASADLEKWFLKYVEAAKTGEPVTVDAAGTITPTPPEPEAEPEKKGKRKGHDRGGIDPSVIPVAAPATNGEAGSA